MSPVAGAPPPAPRDEAMDEGPVMATPMDGVLGRLRVSTSGVLGRMGITSFVWALQRFQLVTDGFRI